jgi:acyl-CoA synthetase (AMP-forming)/AMP-acid ligase II
MTTHVHPDGPRPVWQGLDGLRPNHAVALECGARLGVPPTTSQDLLALRALQIASGLHFAGVGRGELVSLLLPPGPGRTAVAHACWRIGAVVVATSTELTLRECEQAHRQARPGVIIADTPGLILTRAARSPWLRLAVGRLRGLNRAVLGVGDNLADLVAHHPHVTLPPPPAPDDSAAVLFARDSNHQPVGVYYTAGELSQVRDTVADLLTARPQDRARTDDRLRQPPPRSHLRTETAWVAASLIDPDCFPARLRADAPTSSAYTPPGRANDGSTQNGPG